MAEPDALAIAVTAHCRGDVVLDDAELLIVALQRDGAFGGAEATRLHVAHILETRKDLEP